jgi:hypothetical protein
MEREEEEKKRLRKKLPEKKNQFCLIGSINITQNPIADLQ